MTAYYNEIDPYAAQWLRNLVAENLIAPGDVDTRDIRDIAPGDLAGYAQCHFFAGIGGWSRALRLAGIPDDFPVWTGSSPCQPFSQAGKGGGFADERHLWPYWHHLIRICRPDLVFGEQVASPDGLAWFDLVHADLEGEAYTVGASDLCAASVQAPHIRQRLWFVAQSASQQWRLPANARRPEDFEIVGNSATSRMAQSDGGNAGPEGLQRGWQHRQFAQDGIVGELGNPPVNRIGPQHRQPGKSARQAEPAGGSGFSEQLGNPGSARLQERIGNRRIQHQAVGSSAGQAAERRSDTGAMEYAAIDRRQQRWTEPGERSIECGRGESFWSDAEWLPCTDGKSRPVEPGTFPLAHGVPARVAKLRALGNAIVPQVAAEFIKAALTPPM